MVQVYLKNLLKNWKSGIIPPLLVVMMIPMIAAIWPELQKASGLFKEIMDNPAFAAFLGHLGIGDLSTWMGMFYMYCFIWLEMIMVFLVIFFPSRMITTEVDKKTLDMMLSLPIPRWRFLLEKFLVYLTYNLLYPIIILIVSYLSTTAMGEQMDYTILTYSLIGIWMLFFALGAVSLLCGALFLESRKALGVSAFVILAMYIIVRIGGMVESLKVLKYFSIFNYMAAGNILDSGAFPVVDFFVLLGVGIVALVASLWIFQNRELTY